jgi:hypothetical protein
MPVLSAFATTSSDGGHCSGSLNKSGPFKALLSLQQLHRLTRLRAFAAFAFPIHTSMRSEDLGRSRFAAGVTSARRIVPVPFSEFSAVSSKAFSE